MKKIMFCLILVFLLFSGCSEKKTMSKNNSSENESSTSKQTTVNSSSFEKKSKVITELNVPESIEQNDNVKYTIEATEAKDVTEEAKNKTINDSNFLSFYSSGQALQAVKITLEMKNMSGETLGVPFLDNIKVVDSKGVTSLGGWKNEGSATTEFGSYQTDGIGGNTKTDLYEIEDGETKLVSSTVLLANDSDAVKFTIKSDKFNDEIVFELPVTK